MSAVDDMHAEREYRQMMQTYNTEAMALRAKFSAGKDGYDMSDPVLKKAIRRFIGRASRGAARKASEAAITLVFGKKR